LISSLVTSFFKVKVKSTKDPSFTGTLIAPPCNFPFNSGITRCNAFAAPVLVGIMFVALALPLLKSFSLTKSRVVWSLV
jgi:hypothetical protein